MTEEEREYYRREKEWGQTEIGKAFYRFVSAHGRAWITDCRATATTRSMERDWKTAEEAKKAFLKLLRGW